MLRESHAEAASISVLFFLYRDSSPAPSALLQPGRHPAAVRATPQSQSPEGACGEGRLGRPRATAAGRADRAGHRLSGVRGGSWAGAGASRGALAGTLFLGASRPHRRRQEGAAWRRLADSPGTSALPAGVGPGARSAGVLAPSPAPARDPARAQRASGPRGRPRSCRPICAGRRTRGGPAEVTLARRKGHLERDRARQRDAHL